MAEAQDGGRVAQRRRTRRAIVQAGTDLLLAGREVSATAVAESAEVSVRTVYSYFPTIDALILEASLHGLSGNIAAAAHTAGPDVHANLQNLVDQIFASVDQHLPLGRKLIKLTVDEKREPGAPRRGFRRLEWIESALHPARERIEQTRFDDLVSALSVVIGWESFIVLTDIRGLDRDGAHRVTSAVVHTLVDAALAQPQN